MHPMAQLPLLNDLLPEFDGLISGLTRDCMAGHISSQEQFADRVKQFFSPAMTARVDSVVHGWRAMIEADGGITLAHVLTALCALPYHETYRLASPSHKTVMTWAVLFHDISKKSVSEHSDHTHGFRSTIRFVQCLPALRVPFAHDQLDALINWVKLVEQAVIQPAGQTGQVQDNQKLSKILEGLTELVPDNHSAALVAKIILLHHSITTLDEWPQANPLDDNEIKKYINPELLDLLEIMSLVDNDGWELFRPENRERYRDMTRSVFERLRSVVGQ